ncbi:response regulator transcription factor [Magnetospirillum molischianum]|uniref:Putative two-component response transcriptional regulator (OmpR family) n=1 Tax=Magnetospirillum molischianum DSM 120 TaxID=1150626 RepID=H8FQU8_MAGML|nr:response regulator transcription factor [Magnetospirillum molischianum]CCG40736.1 Putative two-component response transcriptional regulator (OmpR family) [Magnetospirillum molischianum DSM 120]
MARIAIVEDEVHLLGDLTEYLTTCGHDVEGCADGMELDAVLARGQIDILILDINLPGEGGFSIAARLRAKSNVGIIMLTARGLNVDRVVGLEIGADVYLVKPVELRELEAQVRSLARRLKLTPQTKPIRPTAPAVSRASITTDWTFDQLTWTLASPEGRAVKLTGNERVFVTLLVSRPGEPVSRDEIFRALGKRGWDPADRSIDSMVRRLRAKGAEAIGQPLPIESVHGIGYAFAAAIGNA